MRRHLVLAAAVSGALLVSACASDTGTRRTVTAVVTVSSGAEVPSGSESAAPGPAASGSGEASASPSPSASASPSVTAAPVVTGVDPLKVDCGAIISAADVKKALNIDIPNDRLKVAVAEVNTDAGQTGSVRCLYGLSDDKKSGQITLRLTSYTDPAAAQKQVGVTVQNETDNSAQVSPTSVSGYPATIALRDGGLIVMDYDNWTLAIAAPSTVDAATLTTGLPQLAESALTRIIKA